VEQGDFGSQYEAGMSKHFGISVVSCWLRAISGSHSINSSRQGDHLAVMSFGQPGLPQSFFVSQKVFGPPKRPQHVFESGNT
jgi:hypothetical protein